MFHAQFPHNRYSHLNTQLYQEKQQHVVHPVSLCDAKQRNILQVSVLFLLMLSPQSRVRHTPAEIHEWEKVMEFSFC